MRRYRQLEHTADIKVEIMGSDIEQLFANASFAVFDVMVRHAEIRERSTLAVSLASADTAELLMDWLRELLFAFSTRGLVVARATFQRLDQTRLEATLHGEPFDLARHGLKVELKTPTYHEFKLEQTDRGLVATVIFDA